MLPGTMPRHRRGELEQWLLQIETIPSVGMYWLAVECTRRTLAPYTYEGRSSEQKAVPLVP